MLAADRRRAISEMAQEQGSIRVSELSEIFDVDVSTIRRDLSDLAGLGVLRRAHGGAVVGDPARKSRVRSEAVFATRLFEREAEKQAIGELGAQTIADGSTIIIDSGTTASCLAHALRDKRDLVVVTNALTTAMELVENPDVTVVMTGGVLRRPTLGSAGDLAVVTLQEVRVDQAFIATHSVSIDGGLSYPSFDEVSVKRAMISAASEVVLIADHSKFGRDSLVRVAPLSAVDRVITTSGIETSQVKAMEDHGLEVSIATPSGDEDRGGGTL